MEITLEQFQEAFMKAEVEASEHFEGKTCSLENKNGQHECPMCYLSIRIKHHLGLEIDTQEPITNE